MNESAALSARYPIIGTDNYLEITASQPEFMEPLTRAELERSLGAHALSDAELDDWVRRAADDTSKRVVWRITAPDFAQDGHAVGSDDLQATLLALQGIDLAIVDWEQTSGSKCEYTFTIVTKIVTQLPENLDVRA